MHGSAPRPQQVAGIDEHPSAASSSAVDPSSPLVLLVMAGTGSPGPTEQYDDGFAAVNWRSAEQIGGRSALPRGIRYC